MIRELSQRKLVDRYRLVDTVGCAMPSAIRYIAQVMTDVSEGIPIEIHVHDDFGLALANSLEGVMAGSEYVSCTMNGLGSRCGNTALEEVVVALEVLYGINTGVNMSQLKKVSELVEKLSHIKVHPHKSVVGSNAFCHETGMTVAGVINNPFVAEAYSPSMVGQVRSFMLGKKSGNVSIKNALASNGIAATDEQIEKILAFVKQKAIDSNRSITNDEFINIVQEVLDR